MREETDSTGAEEEGPRQKTPARLDCRGLTRDPYALFYAGLKLSTPLLVAHHGICGLEMAVLF